MEPEDLVDHLILNGALEVSAIDENTGEFLYSFTEKLEEVAPHLFDGLAESFHLEVMYLWEKGFVNIDMTTDSNNPMVSLSEKALDKNEVSKLTDFEQQTLQSIMKAMRNEK